MATLFHFDLCDFLHFVSNKLVFISTFEFDGWNGKIEKWASHSFQLFNPLISSFALKSKFFLQFNDPKLNGVNKLCFRIVLASIKKRTCHFKNIEKSLFGEIRNVVKKITSENNFNNDNSICKIIVKFDWILLLSQFKKRNDLATFLMKVYFLIMNKSMETSICQTSKVKVRVKTLMLKTIYHLKKIETELKKGRIRFG